MKTGRSGFNLVEMLVVIVIFGILIGLIMPVVGSVRERGRAAKCLANLKQLHEAAINYATDYGELPSGASCANYEDPANPYQCHKGWIDWLSWTSDRHTWWYGSEAVTCITNGSLWPYIGDTRVYLCPTFGKPGKKYYLSNWGQWQTPVRSYGMNSAASRNNFYAITDASRRLLFADQGAYVYRDNDYTTGDTTRDCQWSLCDEWWGDDPWWSQVYDVKFWRGWDGMIEGTPYGAYSLEALGACHDGFAHGIFVDGHTEKRLSYRDTIAICNGTWSGLQ